MNLQKIEWMLNVNMKGARMYQDDMHYVFEKVRLKDHRYNDKVFIESVWRNEENDDTVTNVIEVSDDNLEDAIEFIRGLDDGY